VEQITNSKKSTKDASTFISGKSRNKNYRSPLVVLKSTINSSDFPA
jgi:hypothetical protein